MLDQVSHKDYEGVEGFGSSTQQDVDELNKALLVGQEINPPGSVVAGDGFALRTESLESTLKNTTYKAKNVVMWRDINKTPAYNTVEEYNQIQSYGQNPDAAWIAESDLPEEDDASYERKFSVVKFLGTTRKVSHVSTLIRPAHGPLVARETVNGTMHLLKVIERALFKGNSALSSLQFDGFEKLIRDNAPSANVIDLRGEPLSEDILTDGALTVQDAPNYGTPTDLYLNPKTHADLGKAFFPKERTVPGLQNGVVGLELKGWTSPAGYVNFKPDVFIDDGGAPNAAAIGDASKRPAEPTISTAATTPVEATSMFGDSDAGSYFYKIVAVNRYGRSAPVAVDAGAIAVASGDKMTFGVTPGSAVTVSWYELYRTKKDGASGSERLILRIPNTAGAGALTVNDLNEFLPYCTNAYLFEQTSENMGVKQLAPMIRIPLATVDTSVRWMQLIYLVPQLFTPGHNVLFTNVGRAQNFVGQP